MIDTKEIIKDGDLLYVGRFERYCESSMSGSKIKYSFAYGYFNKGVWVRATPYRLVRLQLKPISRWRHRQWLLL